MNALDATDAMLEAAIVATPVLTKKMLTLPESTDLLHIPQDPKTRSQQKRLRSGNFFS